MPRVLYQCPVRDKAVATGLRMTAEKLQVDNTRYGFRCSACDGIHHWMRGDAWLELARR